MAAVLSIGTTHPLAIAGIGLDLRVAAALDVRPYAIIAGVSAQSAARVRAVLAIEPAMLAAQFAALAGVPVQAIRVGALVSALSVAAVVGGAGARTGIPVVWDPVIAASTGERLADDETVGALKFAIAGLNPILTPNLAEAAQLLGSPVPGDPQAMAEAARALVAHGARAVLVKGGHLAGDAVDVFADASGGVHEFRSPRIATTLRGTGDLLAFALAAGLAHGAELIDAIDAARAFVRARIIAGDDVGGTRAT